MSKFTIPSPSFFTIKIKTDNESLVLYLTQVAELGDKNCEWEIEKF